MRNTHSHHLVMIQVAMLLGEDELRWVADDCGDGDGNADGEVELCPGGRTRAVVQDDLGTYIPAMCEHMLCAGRRAALRGFFGGLWAVVPLEALNTTTRCNHIMD